MHRPKVVVMASASVDGRVTIAPGVLLLFGEKRWDAVCGQSDVFAWLKLTHRPDATLEGSGSFATEGAELEPLPPFDGDREALYQDFLPNEIVHRLGHRGWFTAVDGRGRIRWAVKDGSAWGGEWEGWYALTLAAGHTPPEHLAYLRRERVPYLVAGAERVDLRGALEKMRASLGVTCVLSTGGGRLNGALLRAGLIDEINIDFCPAVIGGFQTPSLFDSPELGPDEWPARLRLLSTQTRADGHVWLRYEVIPAAE